MYQTAERYASEVDYGKAGVSPIRKWRKAKREDIRQISSFAKREFKDYFPQYWKNPYVGIRRSKELPLLHRIAIRIFVQALRLHMLGSFTFLVTRL